MEGLLLSYFDAIVGPNPYQGVHIDEDDFDVLTPMNMLEVAKLMDTFYEEGFYTHGFKDYETANYYFKIPSKWARGGEENLCFSILTRTKNPDVFKNILEKGVKDFRIIPEAYKAFHKDRADGDESALDATQTLEKFLEDLKQEILKINESGLAGKILVLGLDQAGKTSLLNRLIYGNHNEDQKPTIGVNIVKIALSETEFLVYDCGGQKHVRDRWITALPAPHALIFVIDLTEDESRNEEAKREFWRAVNRFNTQQLEKFPILVLGNKSDLVGRVTKKEVSNRLELGNSKDRMLKVEITSAKTGAGVEPAFKWLVTELI